VILAKLNLIDSVLQATKIDEIQQERQFGDSTCDVTLDGDFANDILQRSKRLKYKLSILNSLRLQQAYFYDTYFSLDGGAEDHNPHQQAHFHPKWVGLLKTTGLAS